MRVPQCAALLLGLSLSLSMSGAFAQSPIPAATPAAVTPAVDVRAVCKADMDKLCPGLERDARRSCVEANTDKFSDSCKAARTAARDDNEKRREAVRSACATDISKLCATAEKGRGQRMECLRANTDKLTPDCKTQLSQLPKRGQGRGADRSAQK